MAGPVDIMFAFSVLMKVEACCGEKSGIKTEYICENERIDRCTSEAVNVVKQTSVKDQEFNK